SAFESLSHEITENPEKYEHDWKATLLIELGSRAGSADAIVNAVLSTRTAARGLAERLLGRLWPTLSNVNAAGRDRLVAASILSSEPTVIESVGPAAFSHAAMAVGQALENELRERVFLPFRDVVRWESDGPRPTEGRNSILSQFIFDGHKL